MLLHFMHWAFKLTRKAGCFISLSFEVSTMFHVIIETPSITDGFAVYMLICGEKRKQWYIRHYSVKSFSHFHFFSVT